MPCHASEPKKICRLLICNDAMAKGLDIEYCPVVINYDLLYNAVEIEQRICRCYRQGQESDVLLINLLSKENISDVRILELINKRTLQFEGILGMSDDIVGNFDVTLEDVLKQRRSLNEIRSVSDGNIEVNRVSNEQIVSVAEASLFTTFTKDIAEKVTVSPKYIEERTENINEDLWEIVKFCFSENYPEYIIDDEKKTLTLPDNEEVSKLFYYDSGTRNVPYVGRRSYGMSKDFKPAAGRITLTSILVKGILNEIACSEEGSITVSDKSEQSLIRFYNVVLRNKKRQYLADYDILIGKNESGQILDEKECLKILNQPTEDITTEGRKIHTGLKQRRDPHEIY